VALICGIPPYKTIARPTQVDLLSFPTVIADGVSVRSVVFSYPFCILMVLMSVI